MTEPQNKTGQLGDFPEDFFQNIFVQAGDGIFLINEQGSMIEMNPRGSEILGYSREELIGQSVLDFQPVDEWPHIQQKLAQLSVDRLVTTESIFIRKDGTRIPVEITGKLLPNNQIIGLLRDISERKQAEQALIDSERKFRSLVEQSPDGIIIVDENGDIVEWNQGQEKISGLKRADVLGRQVWDIWLRLLPEETRSDTFFENLIQNIKEMLHSFHSREASQTYETTFMLPDKTCRNVEIMVYSYKTDIGHRVGCIVRDITERKQAEMRLEHLAMHDSLTGLPNRQLFQDRLSRAINRVAREQRGMLAVMMLDLDNFKYVNDSYGHAYGDQLLILVARRLQDCLRKSDTAARMGGDEFILINEEVLTVECCTVIAQKVLDALSDPMEIDGRSLQVSASIGISLYTSGGDDATALLRQADIAMYQAKRLRGCYRFYDPAVQLLSDLQ